MLTVCFRFEECRASGEMLAPVDYIGVWDVANGPTVFKHLVSNVSRVLLTNYFMRTV